MIPTRTRKKSVSKGWELSLNYAFGLIGIIEIKDLAVHVELVKFTRKIAATAPLKDLLGMSDLIIFTSCV